MELFDEYQTDGYGTVTIGEWGGWLVQIVPMIYNDRLVLTPKDVPWTYDYGWCYAKTPSGLSIITLAAALWNPETEGEPRGFIKAVRAPRQPGEVAVWLQEQRRRQEH